MSHEVLTNPPGRSGLRRRSFPRLFVVGFSLAFVVAVSAGQAPPKRNVLIINEVGLSHSITSLMTQQIVAGVQEKPERHVEFYSESLDLMSFPDRPSPTDIKDWLVKKYGAYKLDVVVAVGPDAIKFLATHTQTMFLDVPIVICGSAADQAGNPRLDSRFTGTWTKPEPAKTLEAALRLFPDTRHVFVVGGSSAYDKVVLSFTKEALSSFQTRADIAYLTGLEMGKLLEQLQHLPERSIVFYLSFFQDGAGNKFVNATKALPLVALATNAPLFGMSDTYLGHGIVGGDVMAFQDQGKITARIVSELLDGKKAGDIPIETLPSVYTFDWKELQRWHVPENRVPQGSIVLFREPSLWERTKWLWLTWFLIVVALSGIVTYLLYSRKQLKLTRDKLLQLSGMLIAAGEKERSRLASELHDDFSQRLAVLALGLENVAEALPASSAEANRQVHELLNSASELGADLHTLSHRLHSSTLEKLGLVPGISALCKEFASQQGVQIDFSSDKVSCTVHPDVALCLFRVVQEGLRNVKKHSGAARAQVNLRQVGHRLHVSVRDEGSGFDLRDLRSKEGLGVLSMEERVRQLSGEFGIYSEPGKGTSVEAWVPAGSEAGQAKGQAH